MPLRAKSGRSPQQPSFAGTPQPTRRFPPDGGTAPGDVDRAGSLAIRHLASGRFLIARLLAVLTRLPTVRRAKQRRRFVCRCNTWLRGDDGDETDGQRDHGDDPIQHDGLLFMHLNNCSPGCGIGFPAEHTVGSCLSASMSRYSLADIPRREGSA